MMQTSTTATIPTTPPFFTGVMPLPPSINGSYKPRAGRTDNESAIAGTPDLVQFKQDAALMLSNQDTTTTDWIMLNALREANAKRCQSPLAVTLRFYFPTEWKRDLDGPIKAAIDAAFARLELDDRLVVDIQAKKLVDPVEPRTEIAVRCVLR